MAVSISGAGNCTIDASAACKPVALLCCSSLILDAWQPGSQHAGIRGIALWCVVGQVTS